MATTPTDCNHCQYMSWGIAGPVRGIFHLHRHTTSEHVRHTVCLPACLPVRPCACLPACLPVCLSMCLSARPSAQMSADTLLCNRLSPWQLATRLSQGAAQLCVLTIHTRTQSACCCNCVDLPCSHLFQCRWSHHMCSQLSVTLRGPPPTWGQQQQHGKHEHKQRLSRTMHTSTGKQCAAEMQCMSSIGTPSSSRASLRAAV